MKRRTFLCTAAGSLAAGGAASLDPLTSLRAATSPAGPRILLRSSWQVVNIGDIAHTPGVLTLLERYVPEAEGTLWASGDLSDEVAAMEHRRFPQLQIVKGMLGADGRASNPALADAVARADLLLHGSGPSLVAAQDVAAFDVHRDHSSDRRGAAIAPDRHVCSPHKEAPAATGSDAGEAARHRIVNS